MPNMQCCRTASNIVWCIISEFSGITQFVLNVFVSIIIFLLKSSIISDRVGSDTSTCEVCWWTKKNYFTNKSKRFILFSNYLFFLIEI